ncbi:hypothetical protein FHX82_003334 [Amycolatopsis bartoniae]|uniref:Uncharacterized protein n=1 Tax=Amycolatopsis bartoniae TaxID=941986 RepID=A0A8H9J0E0_9PSEU|nr:hypothetical protein [Amycolatopsis bartoniae]MBB2936280.1 hypothetical protein [Amycolatopsis bartoniae]TVT11563.1 hypothetical protein FNH07_01735 [Amycolatopsis bartoniae]GHF79061.1 hypothetical protein GCM10017566_61530 [Amycolatopsis bartoniae]
MTELTAELVVDGKTPREVRLSPPAHFGDRHVAEVVPRPVLTWTEDTLDPGVQEPELPLLDPDGTVRNLGPAVRVTWRQTGTGWRLVYLAKTPPTRAGLAQLPVVCWVAAVCRGFRLLSEIRGRTGVGSRGVMFRRCSVQRAPSPAPRGAGADYPHLRSEPPDYALGRLAVAGARKRGPRAGPKGRPEPDRSRQTPSEIHHRPANHDRHFRGQQRRNPTSSVV